MKFYDKSLRLELFFSHNDLPMNIRHVHLNHLADFPFDEDLKQIEPWASMDNCATDIPRLRKGKVGGVVSNMFT